MEHPIRVDDFRLERRAWRPVSFAAPSRPCLRCRPFCQRRHLPEPSDHIIRIFLPPRTRVPVSRRARGCKTDRRCGHESVGGAATG